MTTVPYSTVTDPVTSTRFITDAIDYLYGLVFAGCCAALFLIVFFFVIESKDRTLEEINQMYIDRVNPITSGRHRTKGGADYGSESTMEAEADEAE